MKLINDYFIIESLQNHEIKDGEIFYKNIELIDDSFYPIYREVNDLKQFENAIEEFSNSKYKFLLISSHGDFENFELNNENVNSYDIEGMKVDLKGRRIFLSTCEGGSYLIAKYFIKKGAYSVIGTSIKLRKIIAVAIWLTLHLLFEKSNPFQIDFKELDKALKQLVKIYDIPLHYFSFVREEDKMKEYVYETHKHRKRNNYKI